MKFSPKVVLVLMLAFIAAIILKMLKIEGINIFLKVSGFAFASSLFVIGYRPGVVKNALMITFSRFSGIGMAICTVGVLFRMLFWQGGNTELYVGLITSGMGLIILLAFWNKFKEAYKDNMQELQLNFLYPMFFLFVVSLAIIATPETTFRKTFATSSENRKLMETQKTNDSLQNLKMLNKNTQDSSSKGSPSAN